MHLKEFVKDVLVELNEAVDEAAPTMSRPVHFKEGKDGRAIEFDIAISVEKGTEGKGKAGVRVLEFIEGGGEVSKKSTNTTVSRVRFGLEIGYLTHKEEGEQAAKMARIKSQRRNQVFLD